MDWLRLGRKRALPTYSLVPRLPPKVCSDRGSGQSVYAEFPDSQSRMWTLFIRAARRPETNASHFNPLAVDEKAWPTFRPSCLYNTFVANRDGSDDISRPRCHAPPGKTSQQRAIFSMPLSAYCIFSALEHAAHQRWEVRLAEGGGIQRLQDQAG